MDDEVIGITPTPGGLGRCPSRDLTRWCRTGPLATANVSVGHKPMAATAARPLREHAQMLALSAHTVVHFSRASLGQFWRALNWVAAFHSRRKPRRALPVRGEQVGGR